jgi:hypothetical protein
MKKTFTITKEHIKLLHNARVSWNDMEHGAPSIDPKRPYGNSSVAIDIIELLDWDSDNQLDWENDYEGGAVDKMCKRAWKIHEETQTALEIILQLGEFTTGTFERNGYRDWKRI